MAEGEPVGWNSLDISARVYRSNPGGATESLWNPLEFPSTYKEPRVSNESLGYLGIRI